VFTCRATARVRSLVGRVRSRQMDHRMEYISYLRGEADKYRQLAERSEDPVVRQELLDLASTCEEAASRNEELLSGG
jgi:hypothetical protein